MLGKRGASKQVYLASMPEAILCCQPPFGLSAAWEGNDITKGVLFFFSDVTGPGGMLAGSVGWNKMIAVK